ncbi:TIGR02757 family protein [Bacteroidota bacterium]
MISDALKILLEEKAGMYNRPAFIEDDPVQIPHLFSEPENIEISGFLAAMLAWGRRDIIICDSLDLIRRMDNDPIDFLMNMQEGDLEVFRDFKHRTFNGEDCIFFMRALRHIYKDGEGLFHYFLEGYRRRNSVYDAILNFRRVFFETHHPDRSQKHIADPSNGSAAKRINLFLRWMVRKDQNGVDFGIWDRIDPADLYVPLDVHTGNVARKLGLLRRKQNDWRAVEELTGVLRKFDPADPVKYDYALFGLGIHKDI